MGELQRSPSRRFRGERRRTELRSELHCLEDEAPADHTNPLPPLPLWVCATTYTMETVYIVNALRFFQI